MSSDSSSPIFSWQFFLLIAATLGIVMNQPGTLPLAPANDGGEAKGTAKLSALRPVLTDSRLWCDPFDVLPDGGSEKESNPVCAPGVTAAEREKISSGPICVMPVIVRGDAHSAEAHEMRVRYRIATACGLGVNGFVPDDPNHLAWAQLKLCDGQVEQVPVEWFLPGTLSRLRRPPYSAVLVVWIRDRLLFTYPLKALQDIRHQLEQQLRGCGEVKDHAPVFNVIGPYWSGTLVDMLGEDLQDGRGLTFYSPSATMADGVLELLSQRKDKSGRIGRDLLKDPDKGPVLVNLTCTDEELSESLIQELELRGINPGDANSRIVIISDADTDFGRVLPLTFAAKYKQWHDAPAAQRENLPKLDAAAYAALKFDDAHTWPSQILRAYYLSGVEGTLKANDDQTQKPADESKTAPGSSSTAIALQRAEGEHQVDYIARLGRILPQRIAERDVEPGDQGKLVAIGVLGTDVYDKLLLIQALRPIFRNAVFFTDTLDARFMDPVKAIPYTRNLVVSASYGFDLFRNFQVGAPPFRSTEQTGAFLAVQTAVATELSSPQLKNLTAQIKPLRFEIGRTYPVALKIPHAPRPDDARADITGTVDKFDGLLHPPEEMHPADEARFLLSHFRPVLYAACALALLGMTIAFVFEGHVPGIGWRKPRFWVMAISVTAFFAIIGTFNHAYDGIEPATWIQGVSIWPSEFVRLLAFATGFVGLFICHSKVRKTRAKLAALFGVPPPGEMSHATGSFRTRFWQAISQGRQAPADYVCTFAAATAKYPWLKDLCDKTAMPATAALTAASSTPQGDNKYIIFEALWSDACIRSTVFGRNARTFAMTFFFFAAWICLGCAIGMPVIPYRGEFSHWCDSIMVMAASLMLTYLMFWVVDETHQCLRFIKKLGGQEPTIWPMKAYESIPSFKPVISANGISENAASPFIDVCFIGKLSQEAVPMIILPFIVLTLMIIARWNYFADWRWESLILAIFGLNSAVCVCCAVRLRNAAVDAKERAIKQIAKAAAVARAANISGQPDALESLKALMEQNEDGAYLPWHQQPFVSAILLPFGGYGGLGLLEFLLSRS